MLDSSLVFKEDTKDLSILITSKLILLSKERLENPLPKSSIAILLPWFLISLIEFWTILNDSSKIILSVISNMKLEGFKLYLLII